ncbi:gamma-glutamyltransferase 1 [Rhizodiscina lignyota]|uniref:Glutathione hydrolase n=1 Tax=Rhizodiscina lignyota TaxID=1504668 RepID=A0A9P4IH96_9PEZI|nr:gamma-glutamyltransferase 1 [Rhizodiscina lignyota]
MDSSADSALPLRRLQVSIDVNDDGASSVYLQSPYCRPLTLMASSQAEAGKLGAVASENSICTNIGIDLLKAGGNAADALVGTVLCVGTIGMYHSGLGGGGFMLVRSANGTYEHIDFREAAPAAAYEDMYKDNINGSIWTGLASAVPGELRGLEYLHNKYGSLPWRDVVMPAVYVSRYGFPVSGDLVRFMDFMSPTDGGFLSADPNWAIDFAPNGKRLQLNETITRKRYADTLETIAEHGADAFYTGPIAETMVAATQAANGTMTMQDLADYKVEIREPVSITYRDFKLTSCGSPAGGGVALSAMKIFEGFSDAGHPAALNISTHRFDEAIRFAQGQRTSLGDPTFLPNVTAYEAEMLKPETATLLRAKISDAHTLDVSAYNPDGIEPLNDHGTSHVVVSDASGLSISLTTTINLIFGNMVLVPETGIIMNDEMNDFSIPHVQNEFGYAPSPSNYIRGGKRPMSSITPIIVDHLSNGSLYLNIGAAGGSRIITSTIMNIWHVLDRAPHLKGYTLRDALAEPRLHDQLIPNLMFLEYDYDNSTVEFLEEKGHNITRVGPGLSSVQALRMLPNGTFEAAGEPRQAASAGYVI